MNNSFVLAILRTLSRPLWVCALILTGILSGGASAESATNDILTISYVADAGLFGVQTGSNNPNPGETVTYGGGADYFTVRD